MSVPSFSAPFKKAQACFIKHQMEISETKPFRSVLLSTVRDLAAEEKHCLFAKEFSYLSDLDISHYK